MKCTYRTLSRTKHMSCPNWNTKNYSQSGLCFSSINFLEIFLTWLRRPWRCSQRHLNLTFQSSLCYNAIPLIVWENLSSLVTCRDFWMKIFHVVWKVSSWVLMNIESNTSAKKIHLNRLIRDILLGRRLLRIAFTICSKNFSPSSNCDDEIIMNSQWGPIS